MAFYNIAILLVPLALGDQLSNTKTLKVSLAVREQAPIRSRASCIECVADSSSTVYCGR